MSAVSLSDQIQKTNQNSGDIWFYPGAPRSLSISEDNPSSRVAYVTCLPFSILETVFCATTGTLLSPLDVCLNGTVIMTTIYQTTASATGIKACVKGILDPKAGAKVLRDSGIKYDFK